MESIEDRLDRIEAILLANEQHEPLCPALTQPNAYTPVLAFTNFTKYSCDCWISARNPLTDPNRAFGIYEKATENLDPTAFRSRHDAVDRLTWYYGLSRDPEDQDYWGNTHMILELDINPTT